MSILTHTLAVLLAFGSYAQLSTAQGITPGPTSSASVKSISISGNGCPQGTVEFVPGNSSLPLDTGTQIFRRFFSAAGQGTSITDRTKNCQMHANIIDIPAGWQFTVKNVKVYGYAELEDSNLAAYTSVYFSQDAPNTVSKVVDLRATAPRVVDNPVVIDTPLDANVPWSPCSKGKGNAIVNVNFRTSITVTKDTSHGYFGAKNGVPYVSQRIEWQWRQC